MSDNTAISMRTASGAAAIAVRPPVLHRLVRLRLLGLEPGDVVARIVVGALFLALVLRIADNALQTGRVTGLLLVVSEGLVVVLMIIRRRSAEVDRRWFVRLVTILSIVGPPLVRPAATRAGGEDVITAVISALGLTLVVVSKLALGRSFGLVPANRGVVCSGPYRFLRHPIYLGYLITHGAFLITNPLAWNFCMLGTADTALFVRAVYEEQTLEHDAAYLAYKTRVHWRMVPGLF